MKIVIGHAVGAFLGTLTFWVLANTALDNSPVHWLQIFDTVVVAEESDFSRDAQRHAVNILQQNGLGISADSYLGRVTEFYGTILQVSLAAFVLFGFVSFLAIRWQSIQAAEEMIENRTNEKFSSNEFRRDMQDFASEAFDIQVEPIQNQIAQLSGFTNRLELIEERIASISSENEPEENGMDEG